MSKNINPFFEEDDQQNSVDDDAFLRHPKSGQSGYMLPRSGGSAYSEVSQPTLEDRREQLMQKRREIENRTVESSNRSLGLLYESEKVGIATAEELDRQKGQLLNTEARLDDIHSTLNRSEKHLRGIKSLFGGIRNSLLGSKNNTSSDSRTGRTSSLSTTNVAGNSSFNEVSKDQSNQQQNPHSDLDSMRNNSHPGLRQRGLDSSNPDDILDRNLDEMSLGLGRLKGLAQNLNSELEEHNEILNRLDHKTSSTQWRVEKQNKDMNKLLKK